MHANGIAAIANIHCFKDPLAPNTISNSAVTLQSNHNTAWTDKEAGGNRWLNPASAAAQKYVQDIAAELSGLGFDTVMLSSLQFPEGEKLDDCYFGEGVAAKDTVLKDVLSKITTALSAKGTGVMLGADPAPCKNNTDNQYGVSPAKFGAKRLSPYLVPRAEDTGGFKIDSEWYLPLSQWQYKTAKAILDKAKTLAGDNTALCPMILPTADQLRAVNEAGVTQYILYDKDGNYDFDALAGSSSSGTTSSTASGTSSR